jgi:hypothetical protein
VESSESQSSGNAFHGLVDRGTSLIFRAVRSGDDGGTEAAFGPVVGRFDCRVVKEERDTAAIMLDSHREIAGCQRRRGRHLEAVW